MAAGRTDLAKQRVRGLINSYPTRLEVRERLAVIHRAEGDLAQAGRWNYLAENRVDAEDRAFEKAYRDPFARMRALAWRGPETAAGESAAVRLRHVREEAQAKAGELVSWENPSPPPPSDRFGWLIGVAIAVVVGLMVIGAVSFLIQGVRVVAGWFG